MILTDKCKEDFTKWISKNHNEEIIHREGGDWGHGYEIDLSIDDVFDELPESIQNALIIEFFDSNKYFISIQLRKDYTEVKIIDFTFFISYYYPNDELHRIKHDYIQDYLVDARNQATATAIEKANELYNEKHK